MYARPCECQQEIEDYLFANASLDAQDWPTENTSL